MKYLLGIDFGGGASKATLLSSQGEIVAEHSVEYKTYHPFAGACEQEPEEWLQALRENVRVVLEKSGIAAGEIACVAIDSATHTAVLCDGDKKPLRPAIHWTDSRSVEQADRLRAPGMEWIVEQSYHKPDPIWTLPQLLWVREKEQELFAKIRYIFFEKDYIRYCLTGVYCTDYIEAEGSMLFDMRRQNWSPKLCKLAGISVEMLPPLVKPTDFVGKVTKEASITTGLEMGTPVICGTTDTVLEVFAAGAVEERQMTVKLATAGRICVVSKKAYPHPQLINYSHIAEGLWYPGSATKSCAASYRWYRDTFGGDYEELNRGAEEVPVGAEGLMFHPYLNGELTPYGDPMLCGSFVGVRALHEKRHFTRAVMEGISMSLLDCLETIKEIGMPVGEEAVLLGGGAKGSLWRQITADMLGITLKTTVSSDSSLGSAMLAGIAMGIFKDCRDAVDKCIKVAEVVVPNRENTALYRQLYMRYKAVHDALAPIYHERQGMV